MKPQLVLIEGGKKVVLRPKLPTVMGRGHAADLKVPDSKTSRRHCELYDYEGQLAVRDLGSVNGTVVNGHRIDQDTLLSTGDTLTIGNLTFQIEVKASDPHELPPSDDVAEVVEAAEVVDADADDAVVEDVVTIESDVAESSVHSDSADVEYASSSGGSFIGVIEQAEAAGQQTADTEQAEEAVEAEAEDDDDGLADFLKSLK